MSQTFNQMAGVMAMDAAHSAQQDAQRAQNQTEQLRRDVERLLLITEAMWTLLKEQHGYTDEKLVQLMTQVNLRDRQPDGPGAKAAAESCSRCGRTLVKNLAACMYCGQPVVLKNPFAR